MAFNTIEYLRDGKVDFVYSLTMYDEQHLIERVRNHSDRINIINGFLDKLKKHHPRFCLNIIYDIEEFKDDTLKLLDWWGINFFNSERLKNVLNNTSWGKSYVVKNLDELILKKIDYIEVILNYIFSDFENNRDLVELLYLHNNLHIRYLFMKYLVENHPELLNEIYDDITKYLTSYTHQEFEQLTFLPELMSNGDICELAISCLKSNNKELWLKLKEYILKNYDENSLAKLLLYRGFNYNENRKLLENEFLADSDKLFETSLDYKFEIYISSKLSKKVSKELIEDFYQRIKYFEIEGRLDEKTKLGSLYFYGFGKILEERVDKYLSLSKDKSYNFVRAGSMSACYRIGDYVFKICSQKWSYEDVICPNLYLILKNIEEYFSRDSDGIVTAGLEIQKYLTRSARGIDSKYFSLFTTELDRLGYFLNDSFFSQEWGDNCMLLDSYKDADHPNPEMLPAWFKEVPLVLIDRDRIYEKGSCYIKQLRQSWD